MSKPTPLTVFDRRRGETFQEFMEDSPATYESHPSEARDQWLKAHPFYDWFSAAWQNTPWSARKIEPFVRKHWIDMSEFEPGPFRSYAAFFDRRFLPGKRLGRLRRFLPPQVADLIISSGSCPGSAPVRQI